MPMTHDVRLRTRYPRPSDQAPASHLVEIAKGVYDPEVTLSACGWAMASGAIGDDQRLDVLRSVLLSCRWSTNIQHATRVMDILGLDKRLALSSPGADGSTVADIILDALSSSQTSACSIIDWVNVMQPSDWMGWSGADIRARKSIPGLAMYELATLSCSDEAQSVLPHLFSRGLDPNLAYKSNDPVARTITKKVDAEAFIAAGGNLRARVSLGHDPEQSAALWEKLRGSSATRPVIEAWSRENDPDALSEHLRREYFKKLRGYTTAAQIPGNAKSHPQWDTVVDEAGRNCAMYLVRQHPSSHQFLSTKQCQDLLMKRDHEGHDIWFHVLSYQNERFTYDKKLLTLLCSQAPRDPNPVSGRGLLAELMLDKEVVPGSYTPLEYVTSNARSMKTISADKWLSANEDDMQSLCALIQGSLLETVASRKISKFNLSAIANVFKTHADVIEHPDLCWTAILTLAESSLLHDLGLDQVSTLAAKSEKAGMSDQEEALFKSAPPEYLEVVRSTLSAQSLSRNTPSSRVEHGKSPRL